jgi:hypothetical protein
MRFLKAFAEFWYDFLIGDDWKIPVAVLIALGVVVALLRAEVLGDHALTVVGAVLVMTAFTASLLVDVRPTGTRE